jgi:hypothetical protein
MTEFSELLHDVMKLHVLLCYVKDADGPDIGRHRIERPIMSVTRSGLSEIAENLERAAIDTNRQVNVDRIMSNGDIVIQTRKWHIHRLHMKDSWKIKI